MQRCNTAKTSAASPSTVVNIAVVSLGRPLSRTMRTHPATTSPTESLAPSGVMENEPSMGGPSRRRRAGPGSGGDRWDGASRSAPWGAEHVADTANGLDQVRLDRVDLGAQVADVGLQHARVGGEPVVPHPFQQLLSGQDPGARG